MKYQVIRRKPLVEGKIIDSPNATNAAEALSVAIADLGGWESILTSNDFSYEVGLVKE